MLGGWVGGWCVRVCMYVFLFIHPAIHSLSLHTHTHTHTQLERERRRAFYPPRSSSASPGPFFLSPKANDPQFTLSPNAAQYARSTPSHFGGEKKSGLASPSSTFRSASPLLGTVLQLKCR